MKYLISGGGTGGHIFPAVALAQALEIEDPQAEFLFVGALGKMEMERVPKAGYRIEGLWIEGLQRQLNLRNILRNLVLPFKLVAAWWKARSILSKFKPDVVVGVGGYASAVVVKLAQKRGIPTLLHEQNSHAGMTNRMLAKEAQRICVAYPKMERFFPADKILLTGNPIRKDLLQWEPTQAAAAFFEREGLDPSRPLLLILGGSLGARSINRAVAAALPMWKAAQIQVYWQVGKIYWEEYAAMASEGIKPVAFIEDMAGAYAAAQVVVSRAGALSLSELCQVQRPCVLIPSPNVADDHQTANAKALSEVGAAQVLRDAEAEAQLGQAVLALFEDKAQQEAMRQALAQLAKPQAARDFAKQALRLAKREA